MACDMLEPCKFPSLDSRQKRFLWTNMEVDLALHPVVGLVFQVGDAEKFPRASGYESLDPFFRVREQGPRFTAIMLWGGKGPPNNKVSTDRKNRQHLGPEVDSIRLLNRAQRVVIFRLRTGHYRLLTHLSTLGLSATDECPNLRHRSSDP